MTFILLAASQWFFILFEIYFIFQNSRAHPFYCFIISCKSKMPYHWLLLKIPINYVYFWIYIVPWLWKLNFTFPYSGIWDGIF
jgi:hypothetical protein